MKNASLIFLPEKRFSALTSFQSVSFPSLSLGSSSQISLRRQSFSLSRARFRPPGNIHNRSRLRRTKSTFPRLIANSLADFAMSIGHHLCWTLQNCCNSRRSFDSELQSRASHLAKSAITVVTSAAWEWRRSEPRVSLTPHFKPALSAQPVGRPRGR
jgi:hypothetical protein